MKTKRTTIAAVAHNFSTGDSDKNLVLMEEVLAGGETSAIDIYVFPELNISGGVIFKTDLVDLGGTVPDGSHVGEVCALATNSFVVEPPRRESLIGTAKSVLLEEDLIRDVVIDYIKEGGPIDALLPPTTMEEGSSTGSK